MVTNLALRVGACQAIALNLKHRAAAVGDADTFKLADILLDNLRRIPPDDGAVVLPFPARHRDDR